MFSFWSHFPDADLDADRLAEATIDFQRAFDLDFVKTAPNGMYAVEDLGVQVDFSDVPQGGVAKVTETPYATPDAWLRLPEADLARGALARELRALRLMRAAMPGVPIVFTVFSPMTIASKLSRGRIHAQIAERVSLEAVHVGLDRIARSVSALSQAAIEAGADGVFFAHQDTGRDLLSYDDFCEFVVPYDIEALLGAQRGRFNILHAHGAQIRFREIQDYPVQALNWHNWETRPSMAAGMLTSGKCIVGGVDRWSITRNDVPAVQRQILETLRAVAGQGDLIIAPSCAIRAGFSAQTMHAIRDFVRSLTGPDAAQTVAA
ncbi:uroporphyrinogen decarboxylase family protein [Paragemmobacter ruber]|uniref:Uroporphyrinogen decarboxylase n=1 Tax=Paragemmobacter ruber TaxID=1985673 RepID=A0ABW9YB94_9RHOB|nr:uroporphyrinogen decarboxylase family protein [Rhodobacter ruber]NBE09065.1 uroporphyrinogen decarboxylase [Rhodobacter ruber]